MAFLVLARDAQLSNDRVLWENPDDMDADARPQPGMTKEK